jgi:DNA-binding transcriptional LysR family regulator
MSAPKVSLEQWRILHCIINEGGFSQAAKKLNKSQSAISYAVSKMQEQLGLEVLTINGRKAELTEAGELLLRRSKTLLNEAECLEAAAQSITKGWEPVISIAAEVLFPPQILMEALQRLSREAPHTRVEIFESVMSGTEDMIIRQEVDLAICGIPPGGFNGIPLFDIEFDLFAAPDHPLVLRNSLVTFQELTQHRQIVVRDSGESRRGQGGWQKAEQRWTFSNLHTARAALIRGYGFSWATTCLLDTDIKEGRLVKIKMAEPTLKKITLNLVYPNVDKIGPAAKRLAALLYEVIEEQPETLGSCLAAS